MILAQSIRTLCTRQKNCQPMLAFNPALPSNIQIRRAKLTGPYNKAGLTARTHYQECDDPCGYVTDTPNAFHQQINETVDAALQRINEIKESGADDLVIAHALRCYNLIREMASTAGNKSGPTLKLLAAQVKAVLTNGMADI